MGTRSLTHVMDDRLHPLVTIYRQFDGYPSGHGADLAEFLVDRTIVNGIGTNTPEKASNGMGCLAASLVGWLKGDQIGGIYLEEPGSSDHGEDYTYTIFPSFDGSVHLRIDAHRYLRSPIELFSGPIKEFDPAGVEAQDY